MGHAGALISGGADTADAKLAIMEECGFTITRNPSEMGRCSRAAVSSVSRATFAQLRSITHGKVPSPTTLPPIKKAPRNAAAFSIHNSGVNMDSEQCRFLDRPGEDHLDQHHPVWRQRRGHRPGGRSLPPEQQKKAIMFGSGAAVVLRIVLTVVAAKLLELSFLQVVGGVLLLWIGYQLLSGDEDAKAKPRARAP
jgi:hypothetical protein